MDRLCGCLILAHRMQVASSHSIILPRSWLHHLGQLMTLATLTSQRLDSSISLYRQCICQLLEKLFSAIKAGTCHSESLEVDHIDYLSEHVLYQGRVFVGGTVEVPKLTQAVYLSRM